jgi:hypothetical protein
VASVKHNARNAAKPKIIAPVCLNSLQNLHAIGPTQMDAPRRVFPNFSTRRLDEILGQIRGAEKVMRETYSYSRSSSEALRRRRVVIEQSAEPILLRKSRPCCPKLCFGIGLYGDRIVGVPVTKKFAIYVGPHTKKSAIRRIF